MARYIFISPHFDDAVWSCGGLIANLIDQGCSVCLLTVFSELKSKLAINSSWRRLAAYSGRRQENLAAAHYLQCETIELGFAEAAIRSTVGSFDYADSTAVFSALTTSREMMLCREITRDIKDAVYHDDILYCPLATSPSSHIDHVIVHAALKDFVNPIYYYADFPYVEWADSSVFQDKYQCANRRKWLKSALCYRSQILYMFGSKVNFINKLSFFMDSVINGRSQKSLLRLWCKL